jgi:hypothetical protein
VDLHGKAHNLESVDRQRFEIVQLLEDASIHRLFEQARDRLFGRRNRRLL